MTDKEILEEVYKIARTHMDIAINESVHNHTAHLIASFIEDERVLRGEGVERVAHDR